MIKVMDFVFFIFYMLFLGEKKRFCFQKKNEKITIPAGNRTRGTRMASENFTTKPLVSTDLKSAE